MLEDENSSRSVKKIIFTIKIKETKTFLVKLTKILNKEIVKSADCKNFQFFHSRFKLTCIQSIVKGKTLF